MQISLLLFDSFIVKSYRGEIQAVPRKKVRTAYETKPFRTVSRKSKLFRFRQIQIGQNITKLNGTRQLSFVLLIKYAQIDILDT